MKAPAPSLATRLVTWLHRRLVPPAWPPKGWVEQGIPRRLDVRDPGFDFNLGASIQVLMNGSPLDNVVAYDADKGEALRYETDLKGRPIITTPRHLGEMALETVRGPLMVGWHAQANPLVVAAYKGRAPAQRREAAKR